MWSYQGTVSKLEVVHRLFPIVILRIIIVQIILSVNDSGTFSEGGDEANGIFAGKLRISQLAWETKCKRAFHLQIDGICDQSIDVRCITRVCLAERGERKTCWKFLGWDAAINLASQLYRDGPRRAVSWNAAPIAARRHITGCGPRVVLLQPVPRIAIAVTVPVPDDLERPRPTLRSQTCFFFLRTRAASTASFGELVPSPDACLYAMIWRHDQAGIAEGEMSLREATSEGWQATALLSQKSLFQKASLFFF